MGECMSKERGWMIEALRERERGYLSKTPWILTNEQRKLEREPLFPSFCQKLTFMPKTFEEC